MRVIFLALGQKCDQASATERKCDNDRKHTRTDAPDGHKNEQDVATFDAVEYLPPVHAVQVVSPVPVPVLVMDPAAQVEQSDCWVLPFWLW